MRAGPLGYTEALGLPALRERLSRRYAERHGVAVPPERIAITAGASGAFVLAFLALFEAGARVALAEPGYPAYRNILRALGLSPVGLPAQAADRFQPTPALLEGAGPLDGLIVASPANPTGAVLDRAALGVLAADCRRRGVALISDEIYHGVEFGAPCASALEVGDDAVVVNSFSKYWRLTGWRVGWLAAPAPVIEAVERLSQNLFICPPHVSQLAALAALDADDELEAEVAAYARNRDRLAEALTHLGFSLPAPADGAFYLYADASLLTDDSRAFCARMLAEAGVAATPGADFDPARGHATVRFSVAGPEARVAEGARRLAAWLG
jgi:aspartate/methionine/tyrosine aminotransferase